SGSYVIKQKSVRDGCFVELEKEILAGPKNPNDSLPYFVAPEIQSLTAYPNPGNGQNMKALVKTGTKEAVRLSLYTDMGIKVWEKELSGKESYEERLPQLNDAGVYLLLLTTPERKIVFKLMVE
ncbi:MAG TPA: T9SS type A sorting domain-containing protein, partial [Cytophagaceae bacterium]